MDAELARRLAVECVVTDGGRIVSVQATEDPYGYDVSWGDICHEDGQVRLAADEGILLDWSDLEDGELERMALTCPDAYAVACHFLYDDYALADDDLARPASRPLPGVAVLSDSACDFSEFAGVADCKEEWLSSLAVANGSDETVARRWSAQLLNMMEDPAFRRAAKERPCASEGLFDAPMPEDLASALLASIDAKVARDGVAVVRVTDLSGGAGKCFVASNVATCLETSARFGMCPFDTGIVHALEADGDLVLDLKGALATVRATPLSEVGQSRFLRELVLEDQKAVGINAACFERARKVGLEGISELHGNGARH